MKTADSVLPRWRWWIILPTVFVTYSFGYLDRANFGFAAAGGMAKDLGITAAMSALIGALFFLGYFFFQIPGAIYAQKRSIKKLVFVSLILWGACGALTGIVRNAGWLLVIRFALGVAEAAVLPAMLIYLSNWFARSERSRANTLLILGNPVTILWMSVVSGYIIHALSWRWMFVLEGLPAVVWAFVWWAVADERPADSQRLKEHEKQNLIALLKSEQEGIRPCRNYREAFGSPAVIVLCIQYFCWSVGVYGLVLWLPSILKTGSNLGMITTGWLSAVPYLFAAAAMLWVSWRSDKTLNRKGLVWSCLLTGALAFLASSLIGPTHFWCSYGLLTVAAAAIYAPYGPFFAIVPELLPHGVAGGAIALINSMGALGSFCGVYLVGYLNEVTGTPTASYRLMAGALMVAVVLAAALPRRSAIIL